jgi:hypothetical protein
MQMSNLKILGTALILTAGGVHSLFAPAISEPGAYAFYHPDADVLNTGPPGFHSLEATNAFASERDFRIDGLAPTSHVVIDRSSTSPALWRHILAMGEQASQCKVPWGRVSLMVY